MSNVCIIGTLNTEIILGPIEKMPEWGNQVVVPDLQWRDAGSAPSVALPLAQLGIPSTVVGTVGDDDAGKAILARLAAENLATDGIEAVSDAHTGVCVSLHRKDGERRYISSLGAILATDLEMLATRSWHLLDEAEFVLLTGLFVMPGLEIQGSVELFQKLKSAGKITLLDVGWDATGWTALTLDGLRKLLKFTDVFLPNLVEAQAITGKSDVGVVVSSLQAMGPSKIIIKLGADGAAGDDGNGLVLDAGFPRVVADTTAAGEAFNAGVIHSLVHGYDLKRTLSFANAVASLFLADDFDGYPTTNKVEEFTKSQIQRK